VLGEDDEGRADIPLAAVRADNAAPERGGLAFTGTSTFKGLLTAGMCALLAGVALLIVRRRRGRLQA
jgi:LPXTG-motif cell wall-anchored protein